MTSRNPEQQQKLHNRLESLRELLAGLEREIEQKVGRSDIDDLAIHKLKKERLAAKDNIIMLESQLETNVQGGPQSNE
ncbi:YdcH family protein [Nocardia sp. NPDC004860]|uniref:YdcH family protein n=1 Tax=unclassified Nocardia TaxID=2637762 RepID=UPI0033B39926